MQEILKNQKLKKSYDVVIIGGGAHGLATAYYLSKMGITNVAVLEEKFIGYGGSGRNTAILRSNYRTPEGIQFYDESLKLFENLSQELNFNLMFSQQGHFTLAHSTASLAVMRTRAEYCKALGIKAEVIYPKQIKKMLPEIDITEHPRYPILGALYHPPGGIIRHDAVVWAYAKEAHKNGVEIHNQTKVQKVLIKKGKVEGVKTSRGDIKSQVVISVVAGWSSEVCAMAGVKLPFVTHPLQALVTESYKPWLHHVVVSSNLHCYMSQTDRGELVCGGGIDQYSHYGMSATLGFLETMASHLLELFPCLQNVKIQRQWCGLCDMTPDFSPIISPIDEVKGFYVNGGWGTYGFKGTAASGLNTAKMIANKKIPERIKPFHYNRFQNNELVGEKAAASVAS